MDRRTFGPALVVLAVVLLLIYGLPALNAAMPWHNEVRAGDVLDLGDGATAVPPVGRQLEDGTLVGGAGTSPTSAFVLLVAGGAQIELRGTSYRGSAWGFLDQVRRAEGDDAPALSGPRATVTTDSGLVGVAETSSGPGGDGLDVAFKMAVGTEAVDSAPALLVRVRTAPGQFEHVHDEVATLLRSITPAVRR
ncbi:MULTISPECIES: hypothetical protein [Saccharothrix]|uniref:hypothetical protein n=1 Tax=Saccharothrix TaxID=2071 RepID=UPI001F51EF21|nr:hypothetical protein [Saccharothrix sp. CB00851]